MFKFQVRNLIDFEAGMRWPSTSKRVKTESDVIFFGRKFLSTVSFATEERIDLLSVKEYSTRIFL